ncbi:hypothetical protein [Streptomyces sp. NPDC005805]|uniref:hypothetical protein n=1 Tax=Streptomyces sp. NPDC005805 TaxID=3157068 RepID=UPI0033DB0C88
MPRPTAAQYAYGSATVVFTTVALLLLTRAESGAAVASVCVAALALGLVVALRIPLRRPARAGGARTTGRAPATGSRTAAASPSADGLTTRVPAPRAGARVGEHSLRG